MWIFLRLRKYFKTVILAKAKSKTIYQVEILGRDKCIWWGGKTPTLDSFLFSSFPLSVSYKDLFLLSRISTSFYFRINATLERKGAEARQKFCRMRISEFMQPILLQNNRIILISAYKTLCCVGYWILTFSGHFYCCVQSKPEGKRRKRRSPNRSTKLVSKLTRVNLKIGRPADLPTTVAKERIFCFASLIFVLSELLPYLTPEISWLGWSFSSFLLLFKMQKWNL